MKNKFLQISFGVAMILFAAGFFIRSLNSVYATPTPENFAQQGNSKIGKYMITNGVTSNGALLCWVWNTETGKSVLYYVTSTGWVKDQNQLPQNPMGN